MLRHVGPGLIISANIVGSGELIVTPKLGAEHGMQLLWFILLGCVIKVFVQIELSRYAIARGRTTLQAMNEVPGPRFIVSWLVWCWVLMFIGTFFQVAGMAGGIVRILQMAGVPLDEHVLAIGLGAFTAVLLAIGRYATVERLATTMVAIFMLSTLVAVAALQRTSFALSGADILAGLKFDLPPTYAVAFATFGVIGVGAAELIYYPYWCLEKGYARHVGPPDGTAAWNERARGWLRVLRLDAWLSCAVYTISTLAFFVLGATVLHEQGLAVGNDAMISTLSRMYHETFGAWSEPLFLVGAFFVLFSTIFVSNASNMRLIADAGELFGCVRHPGPEQRRRLLLLLAILLPISWTTIALIWRSPVTLVLIGAVAQALLLPFLGLMALWLHHRHTDPGLRSGRVWRGLLWLSALSLCAVGCYSALQELARLR
jgi:Mn2+/Fe2+ NRAMP family transporter